MIRNRAMRALVGAGVIAGTALVGAHHAVSAEFDSTKPITFKGTIRKIEWTNPHIYTNVEVKKPDGAVLVYRVEGAAPNTLFRQGWRKEDLKIGEPVTVSIMNRHTRARRKCIADPADTTSRRFG